MTLTTIAKISGIFMFTVVAWASLDAMVTTLVQPQTGQPAAPAFSIAATGR